MRSVHRGPVTGVVALVALLAALEAWVGLGLAGWVVGVGASLVANTLLAVGLERSGAAALGPANWVTLTRATLGQGVAALVAASFTLSLDPPDALSTTAGDRTTVLVALAVTALLLDAVDGPVARLTGTVSALGARFDMEVDAFLILVLSVVAAPSVGWWVLTIGAARYALLVSGWLRPWLRAPVPPRYWRKVVAAVQGVVLTFAVARVLPQAVVATALVVALALLAESFGRDVWWLARHTRTSAVPRPAALVVEATRG